MGLNIKREETHKLALEVADLTGESLTEAVTVALRERLEKLERQRDADARVERVMEMVQDLNLGPAPDHGELLYDERGLPK